MGYCPCHPFRPEKKLTGGLAIPVFLFQLRRPLRFGPGHETYRNEDKNQAEPIFYHGEISLEENCEQQGGRRSGQHFARQ